MSRYAATTAVLGLLAIGVAVAGCGASASSSATSASGASGSRVSGPFAWLSAGPAPATWARGAVFAGRRLAVPPGWSPLLGDPGSVSVQRLGRHGQLVGYLNATPRQGAETLADWPGFRVSHNAGEGDREVRVIAARTGVRVGGARASCVADVYRTRVSAYHEIACLIARPRVTAVLVGAAPPESWVSQRPVIERAIAGFAAS